MSPPERRLALSGLIRRTVVSVAEREQQRSRLVNILILAQALLTIATTPAYLGKYPAYDSLAAVIGTLLIYVIAFVTNHFFNRPATAAYMLVIGGSLGVAAQAIIPALGHNPVQAGQASLLFTTVILEAGLLFAPEVTLITAAATTTLTAFAVLLAVSLAQTIDKHEAYLLVVYTLGLQALAGLIAWLLSQFIFESAIEAQRGQELQFSQARLEALAGQVAEQQAQLDENIGIIQSTITRAIGGEYHARAELPYSELSGLADSLNLLLQKVEAATQAEQMQARMQAAALPFIDAIARMGDSGTPTPSSLPIITNTPLDGVSMAISRMQTNVAQRLTRVQNLVGEVVGALGHSQDGLNGASESVQEALRIAGVLIATTEMMVAGTSRQLALILRMRRMLSMALPQEITQMSPAADQSHREVGAEPGNSLLGLGPDLGIGRQGDTAEFTALNGDGASVHGIAPLTVPLPAIGFSESGTEVPVAEGISEAETASHGALKQEELIEIWNIAVQIDNEAAQLERSIGQFIRELGLQSRHMRTADANIAWFRQALDAVRSNAEQLQQIAGANVPLPMGADHDSVSRPLDPISRPINPAMEPRGPRLTLPIPPTERLPDDGTLAELAPFASAGAASDTPTGTPSGDPSSDDYAGPPTGSLRAVDLLMGSDSSYPFAPAEPPRSDGGSEAGK